MKTLPFFDLEQAVHPISPDEGTLATDQGRVVRVRTGLRAGGGEGGGRTDRSNFWSSTSGKQ